jgi:glycosyltransferase involved in cell wall biosynthesis
MRVALFRAFSDPFRASMAIYADQLARGLRAMVGEADEVREVELAGARLAGLGRYWDQYVRYQRLAGRQTADVFHVLDHGYGHLAYALPPARTVVTFHDAVVLKVAGVSRRTRLSLRYSLRAIARAGRVVTDSRAAREDFLSLVDYPADRVEVVYPGVDPAFRPPADRAAARRALGLDGPVVLHVGHSLAYMNGARVVGAFARLARDHRVDATLVKVGALTGAQRALAARLGVAERIRELGRVPFADLPGVYGAADVLLYPPLYAGFGLPPLEAMACGTPVVCSDRGSLPEVTGDAAERADAEDEAALADGMARVLTDAARAAALRARGLARASAFTWTATARGVLQVYQGLAGA